jgi:hypothetical protein
LFYFLAQRYHFTVRLSLAGCSARPSHGQVNDRTTCRASSSLGEVVEAVPPEGDCPPLPADLGASIEPPFGLIQIKIFGAGAT